MTNVIHMLYTTTAYQNAVLQLFANEANFAAKQFHLNEPLPIVVPSDTKSWRVGPPPGTWQISGGTVTSTGIGGEIPASNYVFNFEGGHLSGIRLKSPSDYTNLLQATNLPSLIDTNGAYQLATQWIAALSIDVSELQQKYPLRVMQEPAWERESDGRMVPVSDGRVWPLFHIGSCDYMKKYRNGRNSDRLLRPSRFDTFYIQIVGTTKELIELKIGDGSFFKSPSLRVTNTAELLGPPPPIPTPRESMEEFLGGKEAYQTVAAPDKIEAWLLQSSGTPGRFTEKKNRTGALKLNSKVSKVFSSILIDYDSYYRGIGVCPITVCA
jgi:hypothetical protein